MEATLKQLEAAADVDIPPRSWAELTSAAALITTTLFPQGEVALRLTDDAGIRELNRRYRNRAAVTDVLAFPGDSGTWHIGDIALNWEAAVRQARRNGHSAVAEAVALACHALLHLAGYDHADAEAQRRMDERTSELCRTANYEVITFGH